MSFIDVTSRIRHNFRRAFALAALAAGLAATTGCTKGNLYSTKDEVRLGAEASKQIDKEYHADITSPDALRVRRIGERLLAHTDQRPGVPYSFKVLDMKEVNAVSLPGGPVYIFRGLLDLVGDDDDALATIIGHEIGHINGRHVTKAITKQQELNLVLFAVLTQTNASRTAANLASLGADMINFKFSRDDEAEADRRGLSYAYKAGFDPNGMIRFFEKLKALEKRTGSEPEFFRDHPLTTKRIDQANRIIEAKDYQYGQ